MLRITSLLIFFGRMIITHLHQSTRAFLCVNNKNSEFVLKKVYDHLHGITLYRVPHWNDQVGVHNYLTKCKDEFDSTSAIVSSDIFNQHASRSLNTSFVAHFAGMGRSRQNTKRLSKSFRILRTKNEEKEFFDTNTESSISSSSKEDHQQKFYRKHHTDF